MIKDFITMNDKKEPQAYLEISIVELSDTGTRQFDNTWQMYNRYFSATFNGGLASDPYHPAFFRGDQYGVYQTSTSSSSSSTTTTTTTPALLNPTYLIGKYDGTPTLTYSINYLVKNQKGRVLANPKIIVTNGKESIIDLTSDYVRKVTSQILSTSSGAISGGIQRTYDIGKDDGIKVNITPFISPDGYVTLNIIPKYATIKEKVYETGVDGKTQDLVATLLERRNLDLKNIRIKDGETLVIGGMIKESEQKTIAKFPVLGEIPGIGFFFRNTDTTKDRQELVIMITPKIIKDDEVVNNSNSAL
jgi:type II secretory pathway component GspD/PulD (secretin)